MDNKSFLEKHPIIHSILVTILFLLVISIGGAISSMFGVDSKITLFIAYLLLSIFILIYIKNKNHWSDYGFSRLDSMDRKTLISYIPLFIIAMIPVIAGFSSTITFMDVIYIFLFMILVAFVEETVFRGIIIHLLHKKSLLVAIFGSSILFSIPHILNALNGKELGQTMFQIAFALVVGVLLALLIIRNKNIIPLILYHFINNTLSSLTNPNIDASLNLALNLVVFGISILYIIYLLLSLLPKKIQES